MTTEIDCELLAILRCIPDDYTSDEGLCYYVNMALRGTRDRKFADMIWGRLVELMQKWPEFSGYTNYPIPSPTEKFCAVSMFQCTPAGKKWDRDHPYGAARWRLIAWLIEQLNQQLNGD